MSGKGKMAGIAVTTASLRVFGDDLDPQEVTTLLGAEPTSAIRKGEPRRSGAVARTSGWVLRVADRQPGDLEAQVIELLSRLTDDLDVWRRLSGRYDVSIFCGLFMDLGNEGLDFSPETLAALGVRGIAIGFDIYDPGGDIEGLLRHPASAFGEALAGHVRVKRMHNDRLQLDYAIVGAVERLRIPEARAGKRVDELWRTTCLELFVRADADRYFEFNFSPSTEWAASGFEGYRSGMIAVDAPAPDICVSRQTRRLELSARLDLSVVPALAGRPWSVGLSAVIEDVSGGRSYWALAHPAEKPDFHHPDSFVLELPPA